jgi:hypothetical protein
MTKQNQPNNQLGGFSALTFLEKYFFPFTLFIFLIAAGLVNGCKKDAIDAPPVTVTETSFTEEFAMVQNLNQTKGWFTQNNSGPVSTAPWVQGHVASPDKSNTWYGFPAFSYTTAQDEFIYASTMYAATGTNVSSWLLTPVLSVKNGDKISFYTRADTGINNSNRLQVLINKSGATEVGNSYNTVGGFTTVLLEINPAQAVNNYPLVWTKYEHTFSGISGKMNTRVGFRYYVTISGIAKGIGIDLFKFEVL